MALPSWKEESIPSVSALRRGKARLARPPRLDAAVREEKKCHVVARRTVQHTADREFTTHEARRGPAGGIQRPIASQLAVGIQTEDLVVHLQNRGAATAGGKPGARSLAKDSHVLDLEGRLQEHLGTKVDLRYRQGKGALLIHFFNDDDLQRVLEILGVKLD